MSQENNGEAQQMQQEGRWKKLRKDPVWVWFGSFYFYTLLSLLLMTMFKEGSFIKGFTEMKDWVMLFLKFGLNYKSQREPWVAKNPWAFFIAPLYVMYFAIIHYSLPLAGQSVNGYVLDDPQGKYYAVYFDQPVFGADLIIGPGVKFNGFYVATFFIPLLFALITTLVYSYKRNKLPHGGYFILINLIMSVFLTYYFSLMSIDPNNPNDVFYFSWNGLVESLFLDRNLKFDQTNINKFIVYSGYYHLGAVSFMVWAFSFLPLLILASMYSLIKKNYTILPLQEFWYSIKSKFSKEEEMEGMITF